VRPASAAQLQQPGLLSPPPQHSAAIASTAAFSENTLQERYQKMSAGISEDICSQEQFAMQAAWCVQPLELAQGPRPLLPIT